MTKRDHSTHTGQLLTYPMSAPCNTVTSRRRLKLRCHEDLDVASHSTNCWGQSPEYEICQPNGSGFNHCLSLLRFRVTAKSGWSHGHISLRTTWAEPVHPAHCCPLLPMTKRITNRSFSLWTTFIVNAGIFHTALQWCFRFCAHSYLSR